MEPMSEPKVTFTESLPNHARGTRAYEYFWKALDANPGKWAPWPGSKKSGATTLAGSRSRNGVVYEGCVRRGVIYLRRVK